MDIDTTPNQPSTSNTQTSNSTNSQTSSSLAIIPTVPQKPTKLPSQPTIFLDSILLQDVCEDIGQKLVKLIQARNDLVHIESYEKQWNRLNERVDYILSALQTTCIDAQDLAQQKLQEWLKG
jgi:Fe-S-cluster formation regulator IscX/YfhJ